MQSQGRSLLPFPSLAAQLVAPTRRVGATRRREPGERGSAATAGIANQESQIANRKCPCLSRRTQIQDTFRRRWEALSRFWDSLFSVPNREKAQCLPAFRWLDSPNRTRRAIAERRRKSKIKNQKSQRRVSFWTRPLLIKNILY